MVDFSDENKHTVVNVEFQEGQERPPTYAETQDDAVPIEDMNVSTEVPPLALEWNQEKSNPRGRSNAMTDQNEVSQLSKFSAQKKIEKPQKYRGLVNQAMTCYLNSLLQTLYMTPEFRNALYTYNDASEKNTIENPTPEQLLEQKTKNIPLQLQKLFVRLSYWQKVKSVKTVDVTKSFGWTGSEAFAQHDVQELMRILFDALEHKLKDSEQKDILKDLYQGKMVDYVKCKFCGYESKREDSFQDINLAIKPFGATQAFSSLNEALADFVKTEILDGSNQYNCGSCDKKRDAEKGLKITKLPYLLTIQLKRFDFDYETFDRVKLSDRVEFPFEADFSEFVPDSEESHDYELFSVMIHSGSATGGHYYAYIKSYEDKLWYEYNDDRVEEITIDQVKKMFGEQNDRFPMSRHSTNAYMLVYRKVDAKKNSNFQERNSLPKHIQSLVSQEELNFEKNGDEKSKPWNNNSRNNISTRGTTMVGPPMNMSELPVDAVEGTDDNTKSDKLMVKLWGAESKQNPGKIATSFADTNHEQYKDHTMWFDNEFSYTDFLEMVRDKANSGENKTLEDVVVGRMRLVVFDEKTKIPGTCICESRLRKDLYTQKKDTDKTVVEIREELENFTGDSLRDRMLDEKLVELVPNLKFNSNFNNSVQLLLQIRDETETFPRHDMNQFSFKCFPIDHSNPKMLGMGPSLPIRFYKKDNLEKIQQKISTEFNIHEDKLIVRAFYDKGLTEKVLNVIPPNNQNWDFDIMTLFTNNSGQYSSPEIVLYVDNVENVKLSENDDGVGKSRSPSPTMNYQYNWGNEGSELLTECESKENDNMKDTILFHRNLRRFPVEIHDDYRIKVEGVDEVPVLIENGQSMSDLVKKRQRSKSERNYDLPEVDEKEHYFKVLGQEEVGVWIEVEPNKNNSLLTKQNRLKLSVEMDKRMSPKQFKLHLEQYTKFSSKEYKLFERFGVNKQNDGYEIKNDRQNVFDLVTQSTFVIKPGRAMREGEITVSMYELNLKDVNSTKSDNKSDFEIVLQKKEDSVLTWKLKLLECLKMDVNCLNRLNIRQKNNKKVMYDDQELNDINNISYFKDFLYDFSDEKYPPAGKSLKTQRTLFFQRWFPSEMKFDSQLIPVTLDDDNDEMEVVVEEETENMVTVKHDDMNVNEAPECDSVGGSLGTSPQRSPNISGSDDALNEMVPMDSDQVAQANKTAMDNAQNWQSKIYNDPPPKYDSSGNTIQYEINDNQSTGTYPPKRKSPPPSSTLPSNSKNNKSKNSWYNNSQRSTYSINQLREKAQRVYGISNASFVKKQDFSGVTNAAVVEEMKWLKDPHPEMTEQPTEISNQPLGIWDDSIIIFVKDMDETNKTETLSAVELAEFKKQEAIRIGKMRNKNNQNSYSRPERKLEIKDDRWEKRNQLEIEKEIDAKTKQDKEVSIEELD